LWQILRKFLLETIRRLEIIAVGLNLGHILPVLGSRYMGEPDRGSFLSDLRRGREGDQTARGRLLERERSFLHRVARRLTPRWLAREESPSDLVQGCNLQGIKNFSQFRGQDEATFRSWLKAILRNVIARALRGHPPVDMVVSVQVGSGQGSGIAAGDPGVVDLLVEKEEREWLFRALAHLDPDKGRRFRLRYQDDLPFDEIARREQMNPATVRKEIFRTAQTVAEGIRLLRLMRRQRFLALQHRAICLWFFRGRRQAEIAQELGIPTNLVKRWIDDVKTQLLLSGREGTDS
jgi:RNA polymerase sigma factor (sigma-70 family)